MDTNIFECEVSIPKKSLQVFFAPVLAGGIGLFFFYNLYTSLSLSDLLAIYKFALSAIISLISLLFAYISFTRLLAKNEINISKSTYHMHAEHLQYSVGLLSTVIKFKDIKSIVKPEENATHLVVTLNDGQDVTFPLPANKTAFYEYLTSKTDRTL